MIYFSWIGNLGVVPLFLLWAFLLSPIFFFLFSRFVFVTRVLETIRPCSYLHLQKGLFLTKATLLLFVTTSVNAQKIQETPSQNLPAPVNTVILSIGEQYELQIPKITRFSVGSKAIISTKFLDKSQGKFLIKGKHIGFSDVIFWPKKGQKFTYHIYVLSKREVLLGVRVKKLLKGLGLEVNIDGPFFHVSGEINSIDGLLQYKKLEDLYPQKIYGDIKLGKKLRAELIGEVYKVFLKFNMLSFKCDIQRLDFQCYSSKLPKGFPKERFEKKYDISFLEVPRIAKIKTAVLKFFFIEISSTGTEIRDLNTKALSGKIKALLNSPVKSLTPQKIMFQNATVTSRLLSTPELVVVIGKEAELKVGQEAPFTTIAEDNKEITTWKFSGLKINVKLTKREVGHHLTVSTQLTAPSGSLYSGSSSQTQLLINRGEKNLIYKATLEAFSKSKESIPWTDSFFLTSSLFGNSENSRARKEIWAYINWEK
jgi:hypothetical protein